MHVFQFDQGIDITFPEPFDIHHAPPGKVTERFLALRRAEQAARAAGNRLALFAHHVGIADRTALQHLERQRRRFRALLQHHGQHFRDHVAGAAHDDGIAHAHILAQHLVFIVQGGIRHRHAAHGHGRQARHGRHGARAAHLDIDAQHHGQGFFGGELVRQRKTRRARDKAQLLLVLRRVHLVDHAVDFVGQGGAARADIGVVGQQALRALHHTALLRHGDAQRFVPVEQGRMRGRHGGAIEGADAIRIETQLALRRDARIELAQAAGRRIARVGKFLLTCLALAFVQTGKIGLEHHHLAAHVQQRRHILAMQAQGDAGNGADIRRHVFARGAIAARGGLHEQAIFIAQVDGQAIEFHFGSVVDFCTVKVQAFAHAAVEVDDIVIGETIVQRQHRHRVRDLLELRQRRRAHAQGGRIRCPEFGMSRFQRLQFDKQLVVLGVGNGGIVEHVVGVQMPIELGSECQNAGSGVLVGQISHYCRILQLNKRRARVEPAGMSAASISW